MVMSNCRPPWVETWMPSTPDSTATWASSAVRIPFRTKGSWVRPLSQSNSDQVRGSVRETSHPGVSSVPLISFRGRSIPRKFPSSFVLTVLLRRSLSLGLGTGVSTVKTIALNPASSARCTSISVSS